MWITSAADLWKDLKNRYSHGDIFRVASLKEDFYAAKQGDLSITSYFAQLKSIWEEFESLRAIPSCISCSDNCTCGLKVVREYASEEFVVKFLRGLNEQYAGVRSQIMLLRPLPNTDTGATQSTFSKGKGKEKSNSATGKGSHSQKTFGKGYTSKQCTYCNRIGYLIDNCYKKNGFLAHWKQKIANHINTEGEIEDSGVDMADSGHEERNNEVQLALTQDQRDTLMALLQQSSITVSSNVNHITSSATLTQPKGRHILSASCFSANSWILDSGATDHACFIQDFFKTFMHIKPVLVNLPDGSKTTTNICGTVQLTANLILTNELPSLRMIGQAKVIGDLYVIEATPQQLSCPSVKAFSTSFMQYSVHIMNRLPSAALKNQTPYKALFSSKPDLMHLKVFGCLTFACTLTNGRHKLDSKSKKCVFLGYKPGTKGSILLDLKTREIFLSRNTEFYELVLPFKQILSTEPTIDNPTLSLIEQSTNSGSHLHMDPFLIFHDLDRSESVLPTASTTASNDQHQTFTPASSSKTNSPLHDLNISETAASPSYLHNHHDSDPMVLPNASHPSSAIEVSNSVDVAELRISTWTRNQPSYLRDYHCLAVNSHRDSKHAVAPSSTCKYPISHYLSYSSFSPKHLAYTLALMNHPDPRHYSKAVMHDCWRKAINAELEALELNKTWTITALPPGKNAVGCK
ncbi:uncharacterized protein LOC127743101 [Arachis duranensis]|uniref:Uncharacterized protein LOC127743101 n=1 Tax=Arachis duranensis TaxID=130453 RepID=A0A9C6TD48_ARADU|nr:uncharacterized protein LOC127743101 [Arachis duranensis]